VDARAPRAWLFSLMGTILKVSLVGDEVEREAFRLKERGVQGKSAGDGALTGLTAAVEQQLALFREQPVGLSAINGETPRAKNRAGVERHGQ
jgi:hypothetical protein